MSASTRGQGILRKVNVPDVIGGLLLLGVGLFFAIGALDFGVMGREGRLGPGGMPFFAGAAVAVFGLGVVATAFRPRSGDAGEDSTASPEEQADRASEEPDMAGSPRTVSVLEEESTAAERDMPGRALAVLGLAVLAAVLGLYIGFLVGYVLLIVVILLVMERERLWLSLLVAIGAGVVAYFVFDDFLRIPLPDGVLF